MDDDLGIRDVTPQTRALGPRLLSSVICMLRAEDGQGLVEYSMILTFVGAVAIGALSLVGSDVTSVLSSLAQEI